MKTRWERMGEQWDREKEKRKKMAYQEFQELKMIGELIEKVYRSRKSPGK